MFNPFVHFDPRFIDGFVRLNRMYLVSQTFRRGRNPGEKRSIILSHYADPGLARIHHKAVKDDPWAAIIDLGKEAHRRKLEHMLEDTSPYQVYSSLIADRNVVKRYLDRTLKERVRKYLDNNEVAIRKDQTVVSRLECTFGELFIVMKYGTWMLRVKLAEIENC